jgi:hypothetical protein
MWPLIMLGASLLKHFMVDSPQANKQKQLKADAYRNQPFSEKINPDAIDVQTPDLFSAGLGGLTSGMGIADALQKQEMLKKFIGSGDSGDWNRN